MKSSFWNWHPTIITQQCYVTFCPSQTFCTYWQPSFLALKVPHSFLSLCEIQRSRDFKHMFLFSNRILACEELVFVCWMELFCEWKTIAPAFLLSFTLLLSLDGVYFEAVWQRDNTPLSLWFSARFFLHLFDHCWRLCEDPCLDCWHDIMQEHPCLHGWTTHANSQILSWWIRDQLSTLRWCSEGIYKVYIWFRESRFIC